LGPGDRPSASSREGLVPQPPGALEGLQGWLRRHRWSLLALAALSALGAFFIFLTTRHGIGLRDDSFSYFTAAEGMLSGAGYGRMTGQGTFYPLTNFPPLYSSLLALTKAAGLELAAGARLIAGLSFAATILLSGLTGLLAGGSALTGVLTAGLVLLSPTLLEVFSWAHSEDPYLALVLAFIVAYALGRSDRSRRGVNVMAVALASALVLTRYAGLVLLALPAIDIIGQRMAGHDSKAHPPIGLWIVPPLVLASFLLRNKLASGDFTNRPAPSFHLPPAATVLEGGRTVLQWIGVGPEAATSAGAWTALACLILLLGGLALWSGRALWSGGWPAADPWHRLQLAPLHGLHAAAYTAFLLASLLFLDRLIPLDDRILSPLTLSLLLVIGIGLGRTANRVRGGLRWLAIGAAVTILLGQAALGARALRSLSSEGMGFNSPVWRSARAIDAVAELPDRPIYTNNVPALYFLSQRGTSFIPAQYDPAGDRPRADYERQLADMRSELKSSCGYLIILGWPPEGRLSPGHLSDLAAGLHLMERTRDGLIYTACGN
jgi:hypothetical protein